jgi:hypothetical protein
MGRGVSGVRSEAGEGVAVDVARMEDIGGRDAKRVGEGFDAGLALDQEAGAAAKCWTVPVIVRVSSARAPL